MREARPEVAGGVPPGVTKGCAPATVPVAVPLPVLTVMTCAFRAIALLTRRSQYPEPQSSLIDRRGRGQQR